MNQRGIIFILISVVSFAVVNVLVKFLTNIPPHELVFFRSVVSLTICIIHLRILGIPLLGNNRKWLLLRGIFGMTALTLFFYTLKMMPLASAVTIQYLSPIFTVIFAIFINKQSVKPVQWIYFFIAFVGAALIKGFDERVSLLLLCMGIVSAMISGLAYNAIIKCRNTDHPVTIVMYFPLVATPFMGTWTVLDWTAPQGIEWLLLLAIGGLTQVAQIYMTKALHEDRASKITPFKYVGSIFALVFGYFIFNETLQWLSLIGIALVILGVILNSRTKLKPLYLREN